MSMLWRACLAGALLVLLPSAAEAADWPDGKTTYRVLNGPGDKTLAIVCKDDVCDIEPFQIALATRHTPVTVTTPLTLKPDGSASVDVAVDHNCGRRTGTLTITATPASNLVAQVKYAAINTRACFSAAGGFGFVAERISAPSTPSATQGSQSVLSNLRTLADVTPAEVGLAGGGAVVLVALITWPTSLLNSAVDVAAERLRRWRTNRRARLVQPAPAGDREKRWWWAFGGVFAAGIISVFVDPAAGLDASTLRMLASMLTAFALEVCVGWALVVLLMSRLASIRGATWSLGLAG